MFYFIWDLLMEFRQAIVVLTVLLGIVAWRQWLRTNRCARDRIVSFLGSYFIPEHAIKGHICRYGYNFPQWRLRSVLNQLVKDGTIVYEVRTIEHKPYILYYYKLRDSSIPATAPQPSSQSREEA